MEFVGRTAERVRVGAILAARASIPVLVRVQGMPGIGKTALLRQLARDAEAQGYRVWTAAPAAPPSERARVLRDHLADSGEPTLLVADDWHALDLWEPALLERLDEARGPLVLLVASPLRPGDVVLHRARQVVIELGGLDPAAAEALLAQRGIRAEDAARLHQATGGQPFAMMLLGDSPDLWLPAPDLGEDALRALVHRLAGRIERPAVREALDLLALVGALNQAELGAAFGWGPVEARRTFDELRRLTVVTKGAQGLTVDPIVRAVLLGDLRVRDPARARVMVESALGPIEHALGWRGQPRRRALGQLRDLVAAAPQDAAMAGMFQLDTSRVAQSRERERDEALGLIASLEGPASAAIARRWVAHDPSSLTFFRTNDRIDAVMVRLDVRGGRVPAAVAEPALDRLLAVLGARGQLQPGMLFRSTRFFLSRAHGQMPSAELAALGAAMTRQTLDTHEPLRSSQHIEEKAVPAWREIIATLGFEVCAEAAVVVDGRTIVPCVGDATDLGPLFSGVARRAWGLPVAAPQADPRPASAASPAEVEALMLEALRHLRDTVWLEASPLAAELFAGRPLAERGPVLRAWLEQAVADTENMRHGEQIVRALRASFGASRSIDEAAAAAGMAPTTLKRYRKLGVGHLVAHARRALRLGDG
jgi:hypothetical protein